MSLKPSKSEEWRKCVKARIVLSSAALIIIVVGLSLLSNNLWNRKNTELPIRTVDLQITSQTTVQEIARAYNMEPRSLKKSFGLQSPSDIGKTIAELGISPQSASDKVQKLSTIASEESKKTGKRY